jgi:hypothetical protein
MTYFGVDILAEIQLWWEREFSPQLVAKYGEHSLYVCILNVAIHHPWHLEGSTPSDFLVELDRSADGDATLAENAHRKLVFTSRTGLSSAAAATQPHLLEPGDFPHGGAVLYRGMYGAASGLPEESDAWVTEKVIDHVILVRTKAANAAVRVGREDKSKRYLPNVPPPN